MSAGGKDEGKQYERLGVRLQLFVHSTEPGIAVADCYECRAFTKPAKAHLQRSETVNRSMKMRGQALVLY